MSLFSDVALATERPDRVTEVDLPRRQSYLGSPVWRDLVIYFLLVDRFSDERDRPMLDRSNRATARPQGPDGGEWQWNDWACSGGERFQGGTLRGVRKRLPYLANLGVDVLWLSPVFTQRAHLDTYHGYGIQDFLDVDPRFGTRRDLVELVAAAHDAGLRVILDVIFNHTGMNWVYQAETPGGVWTPVYTQGHHQFGHWLDATRETTDLIGEPDDGVWPAELQNPDRYTRAGYGNLGAGSIDDPMAEHKRTDFITLRDIDLDSPGTLSDLARCYKYWVALTGCDGFRIDTLKHVSLEQARNFCGSIKEFATNIGINNFLLIAEAAGGDAVEERYLDVLKRNINAALDIGEMRPTLTGVAKGLIDPRAYFDGFDPGEVPMESHRALGDRHVSVLDDHDHVFGTKLRFSSEAAPNHEDHQIVAGVALQLLTLGIPCIYYGTEQALAGPEPAERRWLPGWGNDDRYLREAMFGPEHPRKGGRDGLVPGEAGFDETLPGFGPFGTTGHHCFDENSPAFVRIAAILELRRWFPVLRHGRQYLRPISFLDYPFGHYGPGELIAWSRILDDEEALCIVNGHGLETRGADVIVDASLNPPGSEMTVILNTGETGGIPGAGHAVGSVVPVLRTGDGTAYVQIRDVPPAETLILTNHPTTA